MSFSKDETLKKVIKTVSEKLSIPEKNITSESSFKDIGADSLDIVEIIMTFEELFGIEIKDEDAEKIKTIVDAVEYIHKIRTK